MFKVCLHCNTVNAEDAKFCRECGKTVFDVRPGYADAGERYTGVIPERVRKVLMGVYNDDPDSYYKLGLMYEQGDYYVKDLKKAFECYDAADTADSMYRLGFLYYAGMSPYYSYYSGNDEQKGITYMVDAASRGHKEAIEFLKNHRIEVPKIVTFYAKHSRAYISGDSKPEPKSEPKPQPQPQPQPKSQPKSQPKPKPKQETKITQKVPPKEEPQDKKEFLSAWDAANEEDDGESMNFLGRCYEFGYGTEKDLKHAAFWYRRSADSGCAAGQYNLGRFYAEGIYVEQDMPMAIAYYRKAADQNYTNAQVRLGNCYFSGEGVERDYEKAAKLYRKAADAGDGVAQYNMGLCYSNGYGVTKNPVMALDMYFKAAEQGVPAAVEYVKKVLKKN